MHNIAALKEVMTCESDFRITRDGTWLHHGSPIARQSLVRLFSTILTRDGNGHFWLQTPAEKCGITVEDAPFIAIAMRVRIIDNQQVLCFKTNVNEWVTLDAGHKLILRPDPETGALLPYLHVRDGLEAKLSRTVYYELMEYLLAQGEMRDGVRGVVSAGMFFPMEQGTGC